MKNINTNANTNVNANKGANGMKEIIKASRDLYKYYPAGEKTRNGSIRQASFMTLKPAMIENHDSDFVDGYGAFGILADQLNGLIETGMQTFHVEYYESREKRYDQQERVIKMCHPILNGQVIEDIELCEPGFTPPVKLNIATPKQLAKLLKKLKTPSAEVVTKTKPAKAEDFS